MPSTQRSILNGNKQSIAKFVAVGAMLFSLCNIASASERSKDEVLAYFSTVKTPEQKFRKLTETDLYHILSDSYGLSPGKTCQGPGPADLAFVINRYAGNLRDKLLGQRYGHGTAAIDISTSKTEKMMAETLERCPPEVSKSFTAFYTDIKNAGKSNVDTKLARDKAEIEEISAKQKETVTKDLQERAARDMRSTFPGVSGYKFGTYSKEVLAHKGMADSCSSIFPAESAGFDALYGKDCITFTGKKKDLIFFFPMGLHGGLNQIVMPLDLRNENDLMSVMAELEAHYGKGTPAKNSTKKAFQEGSLGRIALHTYANEHVNLMAVRNRKGIVVYEVYFLPDSLADELRLEQATATRR